MEIWIVLGILAALVFWAIAIYNGLVATRNRFKNAFAQIDVQLKRRYDLIPNLVEAAKGCIKHERETLEAAIKARLEATGKALPGKCRMLAGVEPDALRLLALIAYSGRKPGVELERDAEVDLAVRCGAETPSMQRATSPAQASLTLDSVAASLDKLKLLAPMRKGLLIQMCFAAITADGTIRLVEAELIRAIGAVLDCPLPPLLETLDPFTLAA